MHEDVVLKRLILWQLNQDLLVLQYQNKVPSEFNTHNPSEFDQSHISEELCTQA